MDNIINSEIKIFTCDVCKREFISMGKLSRHNKKEHGILSKWEVASKRREENSQHIKCEVCLQTFNTRMGLSKHVKIHMSKEEYYRKYIMKEGETCTCKQCGGKVNFEFSEGFKDFCSFSCSTTWYAHNTDRIKIAMNTIKEKESKDSNFRLTPVKIKYWTNKGFSEEEAKIKVSERQSTFSKEKLIRKYGEEEGLKRWQDRQNKWQNTLLSKPKEELERIYRAKMCNNIGYSKVSQELFDDISNSLPKHLKIYYATRFNEDVISRKDFAEHYEYMLMFQDRAVCFLDYYIPEINYCLEFDGDYWHSEKCPKNLIRDTIKSAKIAEEYPDMRVVRIKECDYKDNPTQVTQDIIEDILKRLKEKNESTL